MEPLGSAVLYTESGDMLTQEPIQDQDTIKQKREVGNLASAWRNPEDRNTDTQTDTEMHERYTDTSKRKKKKKNAAHSS